MREPWALVLWVALVSCGRKGPQRVDDAVLLELGADGRVSADGRAVDLDGLGSYLAERRDDAPLRMTKEGRVAGLDIVLRIDPDAYWRQVQWILIVCIEQKNHRTRFEGAGGRRVKVFQFIDMAIEWLPGYPKKDALCVTIDVEHDESGDVRFRCGERTARDVEAVKGWVAEALERPGVFVARVGEIRAPPKMAYRHVLAAMQALAGSSGGLADTKLDRTWLHGYAIPTDAVRAMSRLPVPASRRTPRAGRGVRAVGYHADLGVIEESELEPPEEKR